MKSKKITAVLLLCAVLSSCGVNPLQGVAGKTTSSDATRIHLSDEGVKVNDGEISQSKSDAVYLSNDIVYYKNGTDFTYGEGEAKDMHTEDEAGAHSVINITKAGEYVVSGTLSKGQVAVDLGEGAEDDPNAVVTLFLDGVDITCSVAPGIIFYNVYECGNDDEDSAKADVDTSSAGANVVIADGSVNTINGSYVAKIYKSVELNEDKTKVTDSKKLHKYDGALYSKMSMNIYGGENGDGILTVNAENEGIDTELHLTIYGGKINVISGNDGINTNEDYVSVTTIKGGELNISVNGKTGEGDGIDSNGWLVIDGGVVNAYACGESMDSGLDADNGIFIRGGDVVATGNMLDKIDEGTTYVTFMFAEKQEGGKTYTLKNERGEDVISQTPQNAFSQMVISAKKLTEGKYTLWCDGSQLYGAAGGMGMGGFPGAEGPRPNAEMKPPEGGFPPRGEMPEGAFPERPKEFLDDKTFEKRGEKQGGNFGKGDFPRGEAPGNMKGDRKTPPDGEKLRGPMGAGDRKMNMEFTEIFEIKKGANSFMVSNKK